MNPPTSAPDPRSPFTQPLVLGSILAAFLIGIAIGSLTFALLDKSTGQRVVDKAAEKEEIADAKSDYESRFMSETVTLSIIETEAAKFSGTIQWATVEEEVENEEKFAGSDWVRTGKLEELGFRTHTAFERYPELVDVIQRWKPDFNTNDVSTSALGGTAQIRNGTLRILKGCTPHNCAETQHVIAVESGLERTFLLVQNGADFKVYGRPEEEIKQILYTAYLSDE